MKFSVTGGITSPRDSTIAAESLVVSGLPVTLFQSMETSPKASPILAFTATSGRPADLLRCIHQMQSQTMQVDHAIFINHKGAASENDLWNYTDLVMRAFPNPAGRVLLGYGKSMRQHFNYLTAVQMAGGADYDLYLKADDDDFYLPTYVEDTYSHWREHEWDFSGTKSDGLVEAEKLHRHRTVWTLGQNQNDLRLGVPPMMPPTYAFSQAGMDAVLQIQDDGKRWEDMQWREALVANDKIKVMARQQSSFIYHRHGKNVSCPWFGKSSDPAYAHLSARHERAK